VIFHIIPWNEKNALQYQKVFDVRHDEGHVKMDSYAP
jgi:hypothetical protein